MRIAKMLERSLRIIAIVLAFWAIYWLLLKITGHSPTFEEISLVLASGIITVMLTLLIKLNGEIKEMKGMFIVQSRNIERRLSGIEAGIRHHVEKRNH